MNKITPISYQDFLKAIDIIGAQIKGHEEFLYSVYSYTVEGISDLAENNVFGELQGINHLELIGYCVGEYSYSVGVLNEEQVARMQKDEQFVMSISSIVADKYLSLTQFSHSVGSLANRFMPTVSTLYVYINFIQNIVDSFVKKDAESKLLADLFTKSISICKCTLDLLVRGFETEAFSCWRTLHECECALIILFNNRKDVIEAYYRHMQYGFAFRDTMPDKDEQTRIFLSMKEEMKKYDLKSKDIKKYIEYGWLYSVPGVKDDPSFKLNFRDGLEKVAGLSAYSKRYEMSSEIIHGTPLLIYSNREYFYFLTLLSTYESFFRLEQIFATTFSKYVNEQQLAGYRQMRDIYYSHLVNIHKRESDNFRHWQEIQKQRK